MIVGSGDEEKTLNAAGSAYIFRPTAGSWVEEQELTRPIAGSSYHFGQAVAIDGDGAVCGAPDDDDFASRAGSIELFHFKGMSWVHSQRLPASDTAASDRFGWSVDIAGNALVVGAKFDDDVVSSSGSAYVFRCNGVTWVQDQKLTAPDPAQNAQFGNAIAMDDNLIVVGAWQDDDAGFFTGGADAFGDGLRCAGGALVRLGIVVANGSAVANSLTPMGAGLIPGDIRRYQYWYRNPSASPCASWFNLTNGFEIAWTN